MTEKELQQLRNYALRTAIEKPDFKYFAVSLIDYAGEIGLKMCKQLYKELNQVLFVRGIAQDDFAVVDSYTDETIKAWYNDFLKWQEMGEEEKKS